MIIKWSHHEMHFKCIIFHCGVKYTKCWIYGYILHIYAKIQVRISKLLTIVRLGLWFDRLQLHRLEWQLEIVVLALLWRSVVSWTVSLTRTWSRWSAGSGAPKLSKWSITGKNYSLRWWSLSRSTGWDISSVIYYRIYGVICSCISESYIIYWILGS